MSCDWNILCLDCKDTHTFNDANHEIELMQILIKHASAIAMLAPLFKDVYWPKIEFKTLYGEIDPDWFAYHKGHNLIPIDEYGRDINGNRIE